MLPLLFEILALPRLAEASKLGRRSRMTRPSRRVWAAICAVATTFVATTPFGPMSADAAVSVPSAPRSLVVVPGSGTAKLGWSAPLSNGGAAISDYAVERSIDGLVWTRVTDGVSSAPGGSVSGLANGTWYLFRVAAITSAGLGSWSPQAGVLVGSPIAPASVTVTSGISSVTLSWSASVTNGSNVNDYIVEFALDGGPWTTYVDGVSSLTTAKVVGLRNGELYRFRIAGRNARGVGPTSSSRGGYPMAPALRWAARSVDTRFSQFTSLSCPTTQVCYAGADVRGTPVGGGFIPISFAVVKTTDAGATWTVIRRPATGVTDLECQTSLICFYSTIVAGVGKVVRTTDGGRTWAGVAVPVGSSVERLECVRSTTVCFAVVIRKDAASVLLRSSNGGASWATRPHPYPGGVILGIGCANLRCQLTSAPAIGLQLGPAKTFTSADRGLTWTEVLSDPFVVFSLVTCASDRTCYVLGTQSFGGTSGSRSWMYVTRDGGSTWRAQDTYVAFDGACIRETDCLFSGRIFLETRTAFRTTSVVAMPASLVYPEVQGVECPSATTCLAVGLTGAFGDRVFTVRGTP